MKTVIKTTIFTIECNNFNMIPKIIHQVWEGATEAIMPERLQMLSESWKEKNPDWDYHLWNQAEMEHLVDNYFPDFKKTYHNFEHSVQRWDAIRYMILYKYGGFYADLDTECLEPLDGLLVDKVCCFGEEPAENSAAFLLDRIVGNAIMASIPGHVVFLSILEAIENSLGKYKAHIVLNTTGPFMLTRLLNQPYLQASDISILSYQDVSPLTRQEVIQLLDHEFTSEIEDKLEKAYCVHYFFGSWNSDYSLFEQ